MQEYERKTVQGGEERGGAGSVVSSLTLSSSPQWFKRSARETRLKGTTGGGFERLRQGKVEVHKEGESAGHIYS
ncbi:hypothetical protein E2C01_023495 [Portunus trituberculatus]|uniref:Uncharacterized protein n=1 Tax=Portunus trituberculatus TaxID=210409 RepID=A0A5B7EA73_PORTR|nr:hypothetical protein [Portunus trituberculatus]